MEKKSKLIKQIFLALNSVKDPELTIPITDLGLIYEVRAENGMINITMTLTTMGCPLFSVIENEIRRKVSNVAGVKKVHIKLTFDPPWSIERMSELAKAQLGI